MIAFLGIPPGWFIMFGVVWLIVFVLVLEMAHLAACADERMEQERREVDRVGEWTSR